MFPRIEIVDPLLTAAAEIGLALNSETVDARISVVIYCENLTCSSGSPQSFLEEAERFSYAFDDHAPDLFLLHSAEFGGRGKTPANPNRYFEDTPKNNRGKRFEC